MKKIRIETDTENTDRLLRVAKNIDVAVRFFGEKTDALDELLNKFDNRTDTALSNEIADLDTLSSDLNELYELLNNLSNELKEVTDNIIYKGTK
jgi:ABC-type transporter Mla subunit MlaD